MVYGNSPHTNLVIKSRYFYFRLQELNRTLVPYFHVTLPANGLKRSIFHENSGASESENFGSTLEKFFSLEFFLALVSNVLCLICSSIYLIPTMLPIFLQILPIQALEHPFYFEGCE